MKGVEELVSRGSEHLGISRAKAGETGSSPALGLLRDIFFFGIKETEMQEKWCRAVCSTDLTTPRWCLLVWVKGRNKQHLLQVRSQDVTRPCHLLIMVDERWHVKWQVGQAWDRPSWSSSSLAQESGPCSQSGPL